MRLRQIELRGEQPRVAVEHVEVAARAASITDVRQAAGIRGRLDELFLLRAELAGAAIADERIGELAEGLLNGLLLREDRFFGPRAFQRDPRLPSSRIEYWLDDATRNRP